VRGLFSYVRLFMVVNGNLRVLASYARRRSVGLSRGLQSLGDQLPGKIVLTGDALGVDA
jgi:hypothetical protein